MIWWQLPGAVRIAGEGAAGVMQLTGLDASGQNRSHGSYHGLLAQDVPPLHEGVPEEPSPPVTLLDSWGLVGRAHSRVAPPR